MRIALIHKSWSTLGGTERYLVGLAHGLVDRGHDVEIFCARRSSEPLPPRTLCHRVHWVRPSAALKAISFDRSAQFSVDRAERERGSFDVVQSLCRTTRQDVWRAGGGSHLSWVAARNSRLTLTDRLFHRLESKSCRDTPVVIAVSRGTADELRARHGLSAERVKVLPNPVDTTRFHPGVKSHSDRVRAELGIPLAASVLLLVGTGFQRKGLSDLLKGVGAAKLAKEVVVVAAGADRRVGAYQTLADSLGVSLVLPGPWSQIEALYGAADAFVLPTHYDPCANATLEAMACGLPVVTTAANGASDCVPEGAGRVIDPSDSEDLARAIEWALGQKPQGPARRAGALAASHLSWKAHLDAVEAIYEEVATLRQARVGFALNLHTQSRLGA